MRKLSRIQVTHEKRKRRQVSRCRPRNGRQAVTAGRTAENLRQVSAGRQAEPAVAGSTQAAEPGKNPGTCENGAVQVACSRRQAASNGESKRRQNGKIKQRQ